MSEYLVVLTKRSIKWSKRLQGKRKVQRNAKLKRYIRKGVPNEHRAFIWMATSGAQNQLEKNPGYYQSLLAAQHDAKVVESISTDLNRTFPDNIQFQKTSKTCLQKALYNVLRAYAQHNPTVGYCQGMNFIVGFLLIITKDEEKSFWLMDALLGRILPDYYSPGMLGLKTDQEVLGELVKSKSPRVWQTMMEHGVTWTLVTSRWFICLYVDVLPVETVLRIWDCLFYEGSKILFRVALTLIQQHGDQIQAARSLPDVCQAFRQLTHSRLVHDCHAFMQRIFAEPGSLSLATLTKLRVRCGDRISAQEDN
ncbi:growth hormone-regulated TBC protein 1-A-like isoform X2 [Nerophis ophidion]|nr:growth hormone-regulated TBC protein 1-A-like isoform X2 [Nerophis ophidion]